MTEQLGGGRFFVPYDPAEAHRFAFLDAAELEALCLNFGGFPIDVPSGPAQRDEFEVPMAEVVNLTAQGLSAREIASRLRCSPRTVHNKRRQAAAAGVVVFPQENP